MTFTSTPLAGYAEQHKDTDTIGSIVWYSAEKTILRGHDLKARLDNVGLGAYMPSPPSAPDMFRLVSKEIQQQKREPLEDGTYQNILVRDLSTGNTNHIVRRVVVELVDEAGERLNYTESWDLTFDKERLTVETTRLPGHAESVVDEDVENLSSTFRNRLETYNQDRLRDMVKNILAANHAIVVRPTGGVLFVPGGRGGVAVDALTKFASGVEGLTFHAIPLPGDDMQRDMVASALEDRTMQELQALLAEANGMRTEGVKPRRLSTMLAEHRKIAARLKEYREALDLNLTHVETHLDLADRTMAGLVQNQAAA